jgi:hypothetical protein
MTTFIPNLMAVRRSVGAIDFLLVLHGKFSGLLRNITVKLTHNPATAV